MISDISDGFLLMMLLYLWLMLLLVVGWITATHFLGVSPSSIYGASKIVQPELYHRKVDTSVLKLHWLPVEHCTVIKTATLVYKFLHSGSQCILRHIFLPTVVLIISVRVVVISLSFHSSTLLFSRSNNLVIVFFLCSNC